MSATDDDVSTTAVGSTTTVIVKGTKDTSRHNSKMDLALLLDYQCSKPPEDYIKTGNGQIVVIEPDRSRGVSGIFTWISPVINFL